MHHTLKSFFISTLFCITALSATAAQAEIFFVEDRGNRFSLSFPDSWEKVGNQKPDDKLTVLGPGANDFSACRVRTRPDRRFVIFPAQFDDAVQKTAVSRAFWNDYLGEYNDIDIKIVNDESGLGVGHASMAEATYETSGGPVVRKRGVMFASLYHDQLYVIECSAEASVYKKWVPTFMGIIKSVDFDKVRHQYSNGYYRNFMADPKLEVQGPKTLDVYTF